MSAKTLLESGNLADALAELKQDVKAHPTDAQLRTWLFEMLCVVGDLHAAACQLDIISHQDSTTMMAIEVYQNILKAEEARRRVFFEGMEPVIPFDKPSYVELHLEILKNVRTKNFDVARHLLDQSEQMRRPLSGQVDGQSFSEILDGDDRIAPFLEVFVHQSYVWLPFQQVKRLTIAPPKHLRDLIWVPVEIESVRGAIGQAFLPVLYVESWQSDNDQVRLGRMTEWSSPGAEMAFGVGQRLMILDGESRGLLEMRELEMHVDDDETRAMEGNS